MAEPAVDGSYSIRAVDRVCDLLDLAADSPSGLSLSDAAQGASIPKSTAFRYLAALEARQYLERDPVTSTYRLGLAFRATDPRGRERLLDAAEPIIEALRDDCGETTNLGVLDGGFVVHELVAESPQMMRLAARVGDRGFVHSTALGKAICAQLPEDRVVAILRAKGMEPFTARTITDEGRYLKELEKVRASGFGEDDAENQDGGRCVAVVIPIGGLHCGISVSAPIERLPRGKVAGVVQALQAAATQIAEQVEPR
ncbi:IclR family transcriptional regulator [Microbacterium sp. NPDC087592]|uniref:IclR family transcriptional regulator n=1 Tax=Microbacterium sp. NPDC087592 TaxID=3364193 RepID=UPI003803E7D4